MAKIVPNNPFAFPPSMEVSVGYYGCMDGTGRVESGTETESNAYVHGRTVLG
jgi:acyl-[acyl carrier protein]--UDP-N-acetylglucosamine O-acyltransferase